MYSKEEKLSLLSEMIQFAKVDKEFKEQEYDFIVVVALQLGVTRQEIDDLIKNQSRKKEFETRITANSSIS